MSDEPTDDEVRIALHLLFRGRPSTEPAFHRLNVQFVCDLIDFDISHNERARCVMDYMAGHELSEFERQIMERLLAETSL